MAEVSALSCVGCGAPLEPQAGSTIRCAYCDRILVVVGAKVSVGPGAQGRTLADSLLSGYREDVGDGRRYSADEMAGRDWPSRVNGLWPERAAASSSFGGGWSAETILGPPRVFPRTGDIVGAWAPKPRTSHVEWIEAFYPSGAPPIGSVRVFETHAAGAVFAITAVERGQEEPFCLWQRPPSPLLGSWVLEASVDPPRDLASVRIYLTNDSARWSEIDTIGLVATAPVPLELRRSNQKQRQRPASRVGLVRWIAAAVGVVAVVLAIRTCNRHAPDPIASQPLATTIPARLPPPPMPAERVAGVIAKPARPALFELMDVVWASTAGSASSEYSPTRWSRAQVVGRPNVYPEHGDIAGAWATREASAGTEWIEVGFEPPRRATSLLIVETFNPGAVVRVDDLTDPARPTVLWSGTTAVTSESRVFELELPEPRLIGAVRVVLHTQRAQTWNEIDAVGLRPAP